VKKYSDNINEFEDINKYDIYTSPVKNISDFEPLTSFKNEAQSAKKNSSDEEISKSFYSMKISNEKKIEIFKNLIGEHYQDYEKIRKTKKNKYVRK
jgi:hypothetical protein